MSAPPTCAVIPAAGRGSRLGLEGPKILAPIYGDLTIWTILRDKLMSLVDHLHLVVSPTHFRTFAAIVERDPLRARISVGIQPEPRGMGDAVMGCHEAWEPFETLLVIWGDQVHVSDATLRQSLELHRAHPGNRCTLPVVEVASPYVQYVFAGTGQLAAIRETREGDRTDTTGLTDSGVFLLESRGLYPAWSRYLQTARPGAGTGELNFLPFLVYLARQCGWEFRTVAVGDPEEARGVNTPADLAFFQERYRRQSRRSNGAL